MNENDENNSSSLIIGSVKCNKSTFKDIWCDIEWPDFFSLSAHTFVFELIETKRYPIENAISWEFLSHWCDECNFDKFYSSFNYSRLTHTHTYTENRKKISGCTTKVDEMNTRRTREIEKRICMADAFKSKVNEFHQFRYLVTTISFGIHWNDNIRHLHQTRWCIANGFDALFSDTKRQLFSCCCFCHFVSNTIHFTTITIDAPNSLLSEILRNIYDNRIK